jgi:hypothetical protein
MGGEGDKVSNFKSSFARRKERFRCVARQLEEEKEVGMRCPQCRNNLK